MRRYLRLYRIFWENCLAREAEFRANFWANAVTNAAWLFFFVASIKVIYLNTPRIAGWTEAEAMVLTGTFGVIQGLFGVVFHRNLGRLPEMVRLGTLDFVVTQPVSSLFLVSTRQINLEGLGSTAGGLLVMLHGLSLAGTSPSLPNAAAYFFLAGCGWIIYYSVYALLMTLSFWLIRIENLAVFSDTLFDMARYPADIYQGWARRLFVYALPLVLVASFPTQALFGNLPTQWLIISPALAAAFFLASLAFWRIGIRAYSSASS